MPLPSPSTLSRWKLSVDVGFMLWTRQPPSRSRMPCERVASRTAWCVINFRPLIWGSQAAIGPLCRWT
eukprot:4091795-Lingulodinium_polyedra.AAC.1